MQWFLTGVRSVVRSKRERKMSKTKKKKIINKKCRRLKKKKRSKVYGKIKKAMKNKKNFFKP